MGEFIYQSIYAYGSPSGNFFGHLLLDRSGRVNGYKNPNEDRFTISDRELRFWSVENKITSRFQIMEDGGALVGFVEGSSFPLCLVPVIRIADIDVSQRRGEGVFINSIPKSGTYFARAAFAMVGFPALDLHLDGIHNNVIDWRGVSDTNIHRLPNRALRFPPDLLAPLLLGRSIVGHVFDPDLLRAFENRGIIVVNLIRNLRDQMISNFRALKEKNIPVSPFENYALNNSFVGGFKMFYAYHEGRRSITSQFDSIRKIAELLSKNNNLIVLRYEDFSRGIIPHDAGDRLDRRVPGLAAELSDSFLRMNRKPTATLSKSRSDWRSIWSDDLESFFVALGLDEINRMLGYTETW